MGVLGPVLAPALVGEEDLLDVLDGHGLLGEEGFQLADESVHVHFGELDGKDNAADDATGGAGSSTGRSISTHLEDSSRGDRNLYSNHWTGRCRGPTNSSYCRCRRRSRSNSSRAIRGRGRPGQHCRRKYLYPMIYFKSNSPPSADEYGSQDMSVVSGAGI